MHFPLLNTCSAATAAGLCSWCVNICKYFRIYQVVAPKRAMLAEANLKLDAANGQLNVVRDKLAELDAKLQVLTDQFEEATAEKNAAIAQAEKTQAKVRAGDCWPNSPRAFHVAVHFADMDCGRPTWRPGW
eukprot:SAG22_NODE_38_length_26325_cov_107.302067_34_plen_131_part_00